ncbi:NOP5/NOP56 family protein [Halogranum rubrum]|uniref:rRNA biogenesis protein nop56/nop58 n=1 Tax=Halogranum salarium B-1 TaxID=1210908 RepID=J3A6F0_9EURY|nr:NOP5/NOP56 family protein [Halogranum salarium]EJN61068.1 rRNA biogenesis protein nop56/nop58 [Halogranum salarium B-1]
MTTDAWFAGVASDESDGSDDTDEAVAHIREGRADAPADWPTQAVESGFAADEEQYYEKLRAATLAAARTAVAERERADDKQLVHAVRAMDDAERTANELAERLAEWAGTLFDDAGSGVGYARELAGSEPETPAEQPVVSFAGRVADLADEADDLREFIERRAPDVAPNLAEMAGPVLAARLMSLAGGLDALAKKPSGTVQVLGAEDALFAHLAGRATSPKHGVIFTHEYVRGTRSEDRGSAARAFAGKLTLAARVDHYGDEFKQELHDDLRERIETIRARADEGDENGGDDE